MIDVDRIVDQVDRVHRNVQMAVRTSFDVIAYCDQTVVACPSRPPIERAHYSSFDKTHVSAVCPCLRLMIGIMDRANHGHMCKTSSDASDDVGGPQVTVDQIGPVRKQPSSECPNSFGNVTRAAAV